MIIQDQVVRIDEVLEKLVPDTGDECVTAARYALLGGGKRFRPTLVLAVTVALRGDLNSALYPAAAVEMIHCYSLIHDDLPGMDNDDFRRGKPTVHRAFSEGIAILAGDFLLTRAFEALQDSPNLSAGQIVRLSKILAKRSGGDGMIGGQVRDLAATGTTLSLDDLEKMHALKTGALILACVEFGSVIATGQVDPALQAFGRHLGLAFQIADDILDVIESVEKHGSFLGSDAEKRKPTYVTLLGLDGAKEALLNHLQKGRSYLKEECSELAVFTEKLRQRIS